MKGLVRQAVRFIGLSGIGWLMDLCVYTVLGIWSEDLFLSNIVSSWVGVTFVFLLSTRYVFKDRGRIPLKWKYVIYLSYQCVLILLMSELLAAVDAVITRAISIAIILDLSAIISKIVITPVTMVLNFIVMKGIMERI